MTLTIDGKLIQLHPVVAAMIELLAARQEAIGKRGYGTVELNFGPMMIDLKVFDRPVFVSRIETKEKQDPR